MLLWFRHNPLSTIGFKKRKHNTGTHTAGSSSTNSESGLRSTLDGSKRIAAHELPAMSNNQHNKRCRANIARLIDIANKCRDERNLDGARRLLDSVRQGWGENWGAKVGRCRP